MKKTGKCCLKTAIFGLEFFWFLSCKFKCFKQKIVKNAILIPNVPGMWSLN